MREIAATLRDVFDEEERHMDNIRTAATVHVYYTTNGKMLQAGTSRKIDNWEGGVRYLYIRVHCEYVYTIAKVFGFNIDRVCC